MAKLTWVRQCLRLPPNLVGRDWVVADLHGHRRLLDGQLSEVGFDTARDRLFSVGDLVDRGPDSLATLALLDEPWFHAVLGNHELMLLNHLGYYSSRIHSARHHAAGSGDWVPLALAKHRKALLRFADRLAELPLALHVTGLSPFAVTHGDLVPVGSDFFSHRHEARLSVHMADHATTSRENLRDAQRSTSTCLRYGGQGVRVSEAPLGALPLTYVGHTPVREITVHKSYVYIDRGVGDRGLKHGGDRLPTLLEHGSFSHWLGRAAAIAGPLSRRWTEMPLRRAA